MAALLVIIFHKISSGRDAVAENQDPDANSDAKYSQSERLSSASKRLEVGRNTEVVTADRLSHEIGRYLKDGNYNEVSKALKRMTPGDFPSIWKEFMIHSASDPPAYFEDLLSDLVGRGAMDGNLVSVLNALDSDLGLGGRKSGLINSAFHRASGITGNELIEVAFRFDVPDERRRALEGIAHNIANLMPWDEVEAINLDNLKPSALKALTDGIGLKVGYSKMLDVGDPVTNTKRTLELAEKFAKFGKNQEFKRNLIRGLLMSNAEEVWPILQEEGFFSPDRDRRLDDILLKQYYRKRPSVALALMSTLEGFSSNNSHVLFNHVIDRDLGYASR